MIWFVLFALLGLGVIFVIWVEASGKLLTEGEPLDTPITVADAEGLDVMEDFLQEEFHRRPAQRLRDGATRLDLLGDKREMFDALGTDRDFDARFVRADADGVPGEWTLVDGADPDVRLLYLHGGGFTVGSAISHRAITVRLAKEAGAVVFAPDYRLMPEHDRIDALTDSRTAYRWLCDHGPDHGPDHGADHGPDGVAPARALFVAGDSAGGNLTLALAQQVRDTNERAPDALIGFSPSTDYTLTGPNARANYRTDTMLQPLLKPMVDAPRAVLPFAVWKAMGLRPTDARLSPLFGDLKGLPPTLLQVAKTEFLYDDAVRYAARAHAAGSPVEIEVWEAPDGAPSLPHVWVMFDRELPAARQALANAGAFLRRHTQVQSHTQVQ